MSETMRSGLSTRAGAPVPLVGVRIEARLATVATEVTVTQRYRNVEATPIEAVYVFPLEADAAVCGFGARIGDTVVEGRVEEREKAFADYDDAMMDGNAAFLLDQERPNVFTASVGNLSPGQEAEIRIRYVALAKHEDGAVRLGIPTTVSPRYVPAGPPEIGEPDGDRVNPPRADRVPYGLTLSVDVEANGLRRVESPSHPIRTVLREGGARVELSQDDAALDRDFVLLVETTDARTPRAVVAREDDGRRVCMLSFLPDLPAEHERGHEVIFVLDCSGSMQGGSIEQAKRALALCIRALGERDTFDIVRFGSRHEARFGGAVRFDAQSLALATEHVSGIRADLGGTELLAPLRDILARKPDPERERRILLLTDGQISNEQEVFNLARANAKTTRMFTFGIGAGASEHLVAGLARASRGASVMITDGERIEPKVLRTFARVRTPALDDVRVDWGGLDVEQAPRTTPPVFDGDALTVFGRVRGGGGSARITLRAGDRAWPIDVDLERAEAGGAIPVLFARERIRELEDRDAGQRGSAQARGGREEATRAELVELGCRYRLMSSATSFVAVIERASGEKVDTPVALRKVPVALTAGWGGSGHGRASGGAMPPGTMTRTGTVEMSLGRATMQPVMRSPAPAPRAPGAPPAMAAPTPRPAPPSKERAFDGARDEVWLAEAEAADDEGLDRTFALLMTQRADGAFLRSPTLASWLSAEASARLDAAITKGMSEPALVTAIVLALLARDAADERDAWAPAASKARRFLDANGGAPDVSAYL
ncbi:MAG: VIT domain-containing protein [Sandaracinaceae bacterium]